MFREKLTLSSLQHSPTPLDYAPDPPLSDARQPSASRATEQPSPEQTCLTDKLADMIFEKLVKRMDVGAIDAEIDECLEEKIRGIQSRHPHVSSASTLSPASKLELASLSVLCSQHRDNAKAFARLSEQLSRGTRSDPNELAVNGAIIYPPLLEGFVLLEFNLLVVNPALDAQHIPVDASWIRRYWVVTTVSDGVPYIVPLPRLSTMPAHPLLLSPGQPLVFLSRRAFNTDIGDILGEQATHDGLTTALTAPQRARVPRLCIPAFGLRGLRGRSGPDAVQAPGGSPTRQLQTDVHTHPCVHGRSDERDGPGLPGPLRGNVFLQGGPERLSFDRSAPQSRGHEGQSPCRSQLDDVRRNPTLLRQGLPAGHRVHTAQ